MKNIISLFFMYKNQYLTKQHNNWSIPLLTINILYFLLYIKITIRDDN